LTTRERSNWRIVFMGTPGFACPALEALLTGPDSVVGVVCQPDRPRGRGLALAAPAVKQLALRHDLPVLQPERLRDAAAIDAIRTLAPDLIVVVAYGRILPRTLLDLPPQGCINVHASLLPRHRGAAPIQWAILAGDDETGVTIMAMNEEMDAGDILLVRETPIRPDDTAGTLGERLSRLGAEALIAGIDALKSGSVRPVVQPAAGVTFAPRIEREQGRVDWRRPAFELERLVRAFAPAPTAFTTVGGRTLKIFHARSETADSGVVPGTVVRADRDGIVVATASGTLALLDVQLEGRKRLLVGPFLAGHAIAPGTRFGEDD
jgi:methionyl-tRNA formyltransferase